MVFAGAHRPKQEKIPPILDEIGHVLSDGVDTSKYSCLLGIVDLEIPQCSPLRRITRPEVSPDLTQAIPDVQLLHTIFMIDGSRSRVPSFHPPQDGLK